MYGRLSPSEPLDSLADVVDRLSLAHLRREGPTQQTQQTQQTQNEADDKKKRKTNNENKTINQIPSERPLGATEISSVWPAGCRVAYDGFMVDFLWHRHL